MRDVFIIGSKGIPARYGGFETFVDNLVNQLEDDEGLFFHVSSVQGTAEFSRRNLRCFNVPVPDIGSAKAVLYDLCSLWLVVRYIRYYKLKGSLIYVLACRIGPFLPLFKIALNGMNVQFLVNPDGHEWQRGKWNRLIKGYWKLSERLMIKYADKVICDSQAIQEYIKEEYGSYQPVTKYISYGAHLNEATGSVEEYQDWLDQKGLCENNYYLLVGRFVPENNYELILREFGQSGSSKDLVLITNVEQNKYYRQLLQGTGFQTDERIKFVGTVYNQSLLRQIRQGAYGYIHGHEVGGTNPSLLEALATTKLNLLLDVKFNREVGEQAVLYFTKEPGSLTNLVQLTEKLPPKEIQVFSSRAKKRIAEFYSWDLIARQYKEMFQEAKEAVT